MKLMPPLPLIATSIAVVFIATSATAETIPFERIDTDGDGELSTAELTTALGDEATSRFLAFADADGNGSVMASELREARQIARGNIRDNRQDRREDRRDSRQDNREDRRELREDNREDRQDRREERREDRQDRREEVRDALSE